MAAKAFDAIMAGAKQALAHARGKHVPGMRVNKVKPAKTKKKWVEESKKEHRVALHCAGCGQRSRIRQPKTATGLAKIGVMIQRFTQKHDHR